MQKKTKADVILSPGDYIAAIQTLLKFVGWWQEGAGSGTLREGHHVKRASDWANCLGEIASHVTQEEKRRDEILEAVKRYYGE